MLSREEAAAASVLATQNALIDLGKHTAKLELEKALRIKRLEDLKKYLLKGKQHVFDTDLNIVFKRLSLKI